MWRWFKHVTNTCELWAAHFNPSFAQEAHEGRHKKSHRRRHSREKLPEVVTPSFGEWHDGEEQVTGEQGLGSMDAGTAGIGMKHGRITLWQTNNKLLKMAIEIVDFPIKNGDFR